MDIPDVRLRRREPLNAATTHASNKARCTGERGSSVGNELLDQPGDVLQVEAGRFREHDTPLAEHVPRRRGSWAIEEAIQAARTPAHRPPPRPRSAHKPQGVVQAAHMMAARAIREGLLPPRGSRLMLKIADV
ncbi:hypothetical protein AB0D62_37375 [Streptomyces massasporeus]|uniref:hypothetical protein n=1 Tax=Streptomyces massasporeus TaxID=67324 RepID=UPI0033E1D45E